jgi:signal transduction histidine kinase
VSASTLEQPAPRPATALRIQAGISGLIAVLMAAIWVATGGGYFWPVWVWFGLGVPLSLHAVIRHSRRFEPGRVRRLAVQRQISIMIFGWLVLIWALSGNGYFWPFWPGLGLAAAYGLHAMLAALWPQPPEELVERVDELTRTRRGAVDVQSAELRRIERDLHDGAQARLVALSMELGRAELKLEGQPEVAELVRRAKGEARAAIAELRDLARGIAPPVLADRGLEAAVESLGHRSPLPTTVEAELKRRPPAVVETAAYFVVAEALTNAAKHAGDDARALVMLEERDGWLVIEVADDGAGGADPAGSGLVGLRQRVEALDGTLTVVSPPGEGTTLRAALPTA